MWDFLVNIDWILDFRSNTLTSFFLIFPFFASDIFYFGLVAGGYWLTGERFYRDLGILVAAATLLNYGIKILFMIPRPLIPHLVNTHHTFSFPSGDVQVACMVWGLLSLHFHKKWFWFLSILITGAIGLSRVYLGVHTPLDLLGGGVVGTSLVLFYRWYITTAHYEKIGIKKPSSLASFLVGMTALFSFWMSPQFHPIWVLPAGALLGIALSLYLEKQSPPKLLLSLKGSYKKGALAFIMLACVHLGLNVFPWKGPLILAFKAGFMSVCILFLIPFLFYFVEKKK